MKTKDLKAGSILSESSFFVVKSVDAQYVNVVDDNGNPLRIGHGYVENVLQSADYFTSTESKTMTELAEILINNPRVAMTVTFFKKDVAKTQKAYKAEVAAAIKEVQEAPVSKVEALLTKLIENPIAKSVPGELRTMKGRHYGHTEESIKLGRINFVDMEQVKEAGKDFDSRVRQIDTRTIQSIIVNGVKYSLK